MPERRYAQNTHVPVVHTRGEIEKLLDRHGATHKLWGDAPGQVMVMFQMRDRRIKFLVPMPQAKRGSAAEKKIAGEVRRRWRALLLILKAKLEAVQSEIVTFDEEFLAHIVVDGSSATVGDKIVPEMAKILERGALPPLLGAGTEA